MSTWPFTVQAAYFAMGLEVVFGLIALVVMVGPALTVPPAAVFAVLWAVILGLVLWVMARFPRRERRTRWFAAAVQAVVVIVYVVMQAIDPGINAGTFLSPGVLAPVFVVAMLYVPGTAHWFDRPAQARD